MKVFAEFDTYEEAAEYAQANLDGRYDIQPALHIKNKSGNLLFLCQMKQILIK